VVWCVVAIDATRVRFPERALLFLVFNNFKIYIKSKPIIISVASHKLCINIRISVLTCRFVGPCYFIDIWPKHFGESLAFIFIYLAIHYFIRLSLMSISLRSLWLELSLLLYRWCLWGRRAQRYSWLSFRLLFSLPFFSFSGSLDLFLLNSLVHQIWLFTLWHLVVWIVHELCKHQAMSLNLSLFTTTTVMFVSHKLNILILIVTILELSALSRSLPFTWLDRRLSLYNLELISKHHAKRN
jgi:hypothetical protein